MLTELENPHSDAFGHPLDINDDVCQFCDRSIVTRFGGVPPYECDSCQADFSRLNDAGKLEIV